MKISALRLPAALAACLAVVLTGSPGAVAAPADLTPSTGTAPPASTTTQAPAALLPQDDELTAAGGEESLVVVAEKRPRA